MCPMTMLRYFRMTLFARIVAKQPPHLGELIQHLGHLPKTWASSLLGDLRWLSHGSFWGHTCIDDFSALHNAVADNPRGFSRRLKAYCREPFANLMHEVPKRPCLQHLNGGITCDLCGTWFSSLQQLRLHEFKAHSRRNHLRLHICTTHCSVCLKEFHTRERVLNHVKYRSAVCRANLILRGPLLAEAEAAAIDEAEKKSNRELACAGKRRHHACLPALQLQGPLAPIVPLSTAGCNNHPLGHGHSYLPS